MAQARRPDAARLPFLRAEDADLVSLVSLWGKRLRLYHGHNEGKLAGGGREWRQRRRKGTVEGIPDLLIFQPVEQHPGVVIELKRADGVIENVTDTEAGWLLHFRKIGWLAEWCRGFHEADAFLRLCYGP
jgi:hypothetical protein